MKIWVVEGSTGEYSDHEEWAVCAYKTEALAKKMVELCATEHRRITILREAQNIEIWKVETEKNPELKNKYDPGASSESYNGLNYMCYPVELRDKI